MAEREVIKEFLAKLGFQVDEFSLKKFTGSLAGVTGIAGTAAKVLAEVAIAAEVMVASFAHNMEKLYYASRRTKSSVGNIQALDFAARNVGVSGDAARQALEGMSRAFRVSPGMLGLLKHFNVEPASGVRGNTEVMIDLVKQLSRMPHFVGAQFAQMFGMDEQTFLQLKENLPEMEKALALRKEMAKNAGVDLDKAAGASHRYENSLRGIWEQVGLLYDVVSIKLLPTFEKVNGVISKSLTDFTHWVSNIHGLWEAVQGIAAFVGSLVNPGLAAANVAGLVIPAGRASRNTGGRGTTIHSRDTGNAGRAIVPPASAPPAEVAPLTTSSGAAPSGPLGVRRNNYGNLKGVGANATIRSFATPEAGLAAMAHQLLLYGGRGNDTIRGIISKWAPGAGEGNTPESTSNYMKFVAKQLGVGLDAHNNLKDPEFLANLMQAQSKFEQNGRSLGHNAYLDAAKSQIIQTNHITITGVSDPHAAGKAAGDAISQANKSIARNLAPKVS